MRAREHGAREGDRWIGPVPKHAAIGDAPSAARDAEPLREARRRGLLQRLRHLPPRCDDEPRPPFEPARQRLVAQALRRLELFFGIGKHRAKPRREGEQRPFKKRQRLGQTVRGRRNALDERMNFAFEIVFALGIARPRTHLRMHEQKKLLHRAARLAIADARHRARTGQRARRA